MSKTIITSWLYTDIDVLACAVAYKNILQLLGKESFVSISTEFGGTIPKDILSWWFSLDLVDIQDSDQVIIVDTSDPKYIDKRVNQDNIVEVFDHHPWYEAYRKEKIWDTFHLEHIGACATLIYEEAVKYWVLEKLEKYSIDLLLTAIVSNTLNFKAQITNERDIIAYSELRLLSSLPANWIEIYFMQVEKDMLANPEDAIVNDMKALPILGTNVTVAQIELRDSYDFMMNNVVLIEKLASWYWNEEWFYTSPSIWKWINNIFTKSDLLKKVLTEKIWATFDGEFWTTQQLWLRKEIWKKLM